VSFGAVLIGCLLFFWLRPAARIQRDYEQWVQGREWWDYSLTARANASNRMSALNQVIPDMVELCIEDLEEKEPLRDRVIARMPALIRGYLPLPRQFRPREYAAMWFLRDLGHSGSNAIPAVINCLPGSDINQSMFAAWTLGAIGAGEPEVARALEGATNFTHMAVHVMAGFSLWRLQPDRNDAAAIVDVGLREKTVATEAAAINTVHAIGELGRAGRRFAPALRHCLTNYISGGELDVHLRAVATMSL
jgi:hypothetical protein